jgi:hypothetical protein
MSFSWSEFQLEPDTEKLIALGTLEVTLSRSEMEWITAYQYRQDRYVNESTKQVAAFRTIANNSGWQLKAQPSTADRNVVVRPVQTIQIPHGETVSLYIGTPVWLQILIVGTDHKLIDLPVEILSDSWFGSNTMNGEICYANQTQARLDLTKLTQRADRLITPVTIRNLGGETLTIERLNLPVPNLAVYDTGASLWTQNVDITHTGKLEMTEVKFPLQPPLQFPEATLVNEPRSVEHNNLVMRAVELLFDGKAS